MSTAAINSPVQTSQRITVPFYPGSRYVAYPACNSEEVRPIINCIFMLFDDLVGRDCYFVQ